MGEQLHGLVQFFTIECNYIIVLKEIFNKLKKKKLTMSLFIKKKKTLQKLNRRKMHYISTYHALIRLLVVKFLWCYNVNWIFTKALKLKCFSQNCDLIKDL